MNKLDKFTPKQVKLNFSSKESWLKIRKKVKDSKCENCGKLHIDCDGDIVLATFTDRMNAHVCKECGEYLIGKGAVNIDILKANNQTIKEKLIKQADRLPGSNRWYKKSSELTIDELKSRISSTIKKEREQFHEFLNYKYRSILEEFVDALNYKHPEYPITYFEAFKDVPDELYDYDSDDNYRHHRWCSYFDATIKLGDKTFSYGWANANGDNSLEDAGFYPNDVWDSMSVVIPKEEFIPKKYIIITADTNDGDYIIEKNLIDDENIEIIKPIISEIIKNNGDFRCGDIGNSGIDLYGEMNGYDIFYEYIPYGEHGIHTIESIEIIEVSNEYKLM